MLQRAASNAYSWWWASHIRTKQSKWLESSLHDMEGKVKSILEAIMDTDNSGNQVKPELTNSVEEFFKGYKELAKRYDYISDELQKANNAMARIFPEQAHFGMEDHDGDGGPSSPTVVKSSPRNSRPQDPSTSSSQLTLGKSLTNSPAVKKQGKQAWYSQIISRDRAHEEIDKLQKGILILQTEKEFIKSSFESGMTKYWDIEKLIAQMQEKVNGLIDEFNASVVIEDHDAQALMAITALRSCEINLISLHEQQKRYAKEYGIESQNIKNVVQKLRVIKCQHGQSDPKSYPSTDEDAMLTSAKDELEEGICNFNQESLELQEMYEKIRDNFKNDRSILMLVEEINHLSEKAIRMQTRLLSHVARIQRLRLDIVEIQKHLQILEKDEKISISGLNAFCHSIELVEVALPRVQELDKQIQDENDQIQAHFIEACYTLNDLSKRLQFHEQQNLGSVLDSCDDNTAQIYVYEIQLGNPGHHILPEERTSNGQTDKGSLFSAEPNCNLIKSTRSISREIMEHEDKSKCSLHGDEHPDVNVIMQKGIYSSDDSTSTDEEKKSRGEIAAEESSSKEEDLHGQIWKGPNDETEDPYLSKLQELLKSGLEDREKILLTEYTTILRNHKETKRKLAEAEKKNQDLLSKATAEVRDLKNVIVIKDQEICSLRQNLHLFESGWKETSDFQVPDTDETKHRSLSRAKERGASLFSIAFNGENSDFQVPETDDPKCRRHFHAKEREASWFSIALNGPENLDAEINGRTLCELKEDTPSQDDKQSGVEDKEPPFGGPVEQVDNEQKQNNDNAMNHKENAMEHQYQEQKVMTAVEEKFRRDIDKLLEENLHFWSRCTSSFEQRNNYQLKIEDIQKDIMKLSEENMQEGSISTKELSDEPDSTSICKQLCDLQEQFSDWIKQNCILKEELRNRFLLLFNIEEELLRASSQEPSKEEDKQISEYYKSIFQGELLRMKEENNKVSEELQEGLDCIKGLCNEAVKAVEKIEGSPKKSEIKVPKAHHAKGFTKRLPLRSFLFGSKTKKPALFPCINPALQKKFSDITSECPPK